MIIVTVISLLCQGACSNRACPYLHVSVRSDAPVCKAFSQGYCARGAACPHKHLTARMVKQLSRAQGRQQFQEKQQQQVGVTARTSVCSLLDLWKHVLDTMPLAACEVVLCCE